MTELVTRCQCARFSPQAGCRSSMTQEDLLCDICRAGCNAAISTDGDSCRHAKFTDFRFNWTPSGTEKEKP